MIYTCRDCKYWGGNNKRRINSVGESKCLKSKRLIKEKKDIHVVLLVMNLSLDMEGIAGEWE